MSRIYFDPTAPGQILLRKIGTFAVDLFWALVTIGIGWGLIVLMWAAFGR